LFAGWNNISVSNIKWVELNLRNLHLHLVLLHLHNRAGGTPLPLHLLHLLHPLPNSNRSMDRPDRTEVAGAVVVAPRDGLVTAAGCNDVCAYEFSDRPLEGLRHPRSWQHTHRMKDRTHQQVEIPQTDTF
jgi:hypothetical protein